MNGVLVLLFLLALTGLIVGLLKPHIFSRVLKQHSTRRHIGISFGLLTVLLLLLVGATAPKNTQSTSTNLKSTSAVKIIAKLKSNAPVITTKTVTTTQPIAFTTTTEQDASLASGSTQVKTQGVNGVQTQAYSTIYTNGKETSREPVSTVVTIPPVTKVVEQGTYVAPATPRQSSNTQSCYPLSNGGNCYEPGEYCSNADHGMSGVTGDGKSIVCAYNDGWRWEPE